MILMFVFYFKHEYYEKEILHVVDKLKFKPTSGCNQTVKILLYSQSTS